MGGMGEPGTAVDCSGLVRQCVMASGLPDPVKGSKGDKEWQSGVALILNSPSVRESSISEARVGDILSINTGRGKGPDGKYDHTGMITEILYDEEDNYTGFKFIHSGSKGPKEVTYTVGGIGYYDDRIKGVYQWDTPDSKPALKSENSNSIQTNAAINVSKYPGTDRYQSIISASPTPKLSFTLKESNTPIVRDIGEVLNYFGY